MLELIHSTWISRLIQWLRPKGMTTLAWQRARRALRSQPGKFVRRIN
jgi:hypothetical protein